MLKFLHIGDVHLNKTFITKDEQIRKKMVRSLEQTFMNAVEYCIDNKLDALVIAGDLFDQPKVSYRKRAFIIRAFEKLKLNNVMVYYASGNHDYTDMNSDIRKIDYPDNVFTFFDSTPKSYSIKGYTIVGCGHMVEKETRNLIELFPPGDVAVVHSMIHSSISNNEGDYLPSDIKTIEKKNYKYTALGHIHKRGSINKDKNIFYSGCIQGLNINEAGNKGGYLVEIDESLDVTFVPLSSLVFQHFDLECLGEDLDTLYNHINRTIKEKYLNFDNLALQINLTGKTKLYKYLRNDKQVEDLVFGLKEQLGLFDLRFKCLIKPDYDIDSFKDKKTVVSQILEDLESVNLEELPLEFLGELPSKENIAEDILAYFMEGKDDY